MSRLRTARHAALALTVALSGVALAIPASPALAGLADCRVKNTATGVTKRSLQAAVDSAKPGRTLEVRGLCVGTTIIDKSLTIVGRKDASLGAPILDGDGAFHVLWVDPGTTVRLSSLTVRGGDASGPAPDNAGGGIRNDGTLTLTDVTVKGSSAYLGGGIYTTGKLVLNGTTKILENQAVNEGGGVSIDRNGGLDAALVLNDRSAIHHNTSTSNGGGVSNQGGRLTMNDVAAIHHNQAETNGSGVANRGVMVMSDSSVVRDNASLGGTSASAVEVWGEPGWPDVALRMSGASRVRDNISALNGGGVARWADCSGIAPVFVGVKSRAVHNTPVNMVVITGC